MRPTCMNCVRKHLAQAYVLLDESLGRYPQHFWLAIGHMAEAEDEAMDQFPEFAMSIRTARQDLISDPKMKFFVLDYIEKATALDLNSKGCEGCNYK